MNSPVDIKVNEDYSAIVDDWQRVDWNNIFIDGKPLTEIMDDMGISIDDLGDPGGEEKLRNFFSTVILGKYSGDDKAAYDNS